MPAFKLALDRLRNAVANTTDPGKNGGTDLAYALYVLARNGAAPIGDLRYLADAKLDDVDDADRQGAARRGAGAGRRPRAGRAGLCRGACRDRARRRRDLVGREDYGSTLRDAAALVTLASEGGAPRATVQAAVQRVEARARGPCVRPRPRKMPGWCSRRARMAKDAGNVSLDVDGERDQQAALSAPSAPPN